VSLAASPDSLQNSVLVTEAQPRTCQIQDCNRTRFVNDIVKNVKHRVSRRRRYSGTTGTSRTATQVFQPRIERRNGHVATQNRKICYGKLYA
jgi:hypothetical protein